LNRLVLKLIISSLHHGLHNSKSTYEREIKIILVHKHAAEDAHLNAITTIILVFKLVGCRESILPLACALAHNKQGNFSRSSSLLTTFSLPSRAALIMV